MTGSKIAKLAVIMMLFVLLAVLARSCISRLTDTDVDSGYKYLIGVSQPNLSEPWRVAMNEEIQQEVSKHNDMRVIFTDAAQSSEQQAQDVKKLVGYGIDLLIISLDDPVALTQTVTAVYKDIPVIVLGRGVTGYDYTLYVGTDDEMIGRKAGEFAMETLGDSGGAIVEIQGLAGSPTVDDRSKGFREAIQNSKLHIVKTMNADWQRDRAEDLLYEWLKENNDVNLVFAHNEAMALGAYRAVQKLDRNHINIIGIDGVNSENGSLQLVSENKLTGTFTSPPGGKEAIRYAIDILNKEKGIPKKVILRSQKITDQWEDTTSRITPSPDPSPEQGDAPIVVGFAQVGMESGWRIAHTKSVIDAAKEAGVQLLYENAEQSQDKQIEIIRQFIKEKVQVIAFSPKTETGWDEVLQEAKQAGIPVILSDREVNVGDDTLWTAYIGSDFREEGRRAARWLMQQAEAGQSYQIVELQGTAYSAPAVGRRQGFNEVIQTDHNFTIVESLQGDFTKKQGKELMAAALKRQGAKINVVYSHNDDMALGAVEAIENFGLRPGKDIIIISVDATKSALKALSIGKLNFAVECNALLGPQLMKAVKDLSEGKELPMKIITAEGVFTQESAKMALASREY
ncbi:simple sugar transport system substrate-binding protein [Paenibacillus castaneae]|uniref:substrate-binding domain-containing protein n=1 Tax=Paenibacillus castaneae TaxID=474957 RepID=UPI000C9B8E0C|nr:substrate-binding domain-containing protein [Paenibacillus castaneae]NIK75429.1 simple sugar transport system substrate-binding protein [Paenibacillus castaneae]